MEKVMTKGNMTPDATKCRSPGPPPHQATFTSTPCCSRKCTCEARKQRDEMHQKIRNWLMEREMMKKNEHSLEEAENKDSGINFSYDSDKENCP
ncbi:hypothetical protein QQG55_8380 [Brugia pahangi]